MRERRARQDLADREPQFIECRRYPVLRNGLDSEFFVAAALVLDECVPSDHDTGRRSVMSPRIGRDLMAMRR